jgi:hypothetical protein
MTQSSSARVVVELPFDPCDVRELVQTRQLIIKHRRNALLCRPLRRFSTQANNNAVVSVDSEQVRSACDAVPVIADIVPLMIDVLRVIGVGLVCKVPEVVFAAFKDCRVLATVS